MGSGWVQVAGMRNLSPHRKFRGTSTVKAAFRPHYQREWPKDLPEGCQICGTGFRMGWNLQMVPNRMGRWLRKAAYVSFLPCLVAPFFVMSYFPNWLQGLSGSRGWWLFFGFMFFPPMAMSLASLFTPIVRHVACKKCGWNRDYPVVKPETIKRDVDSIS